MVFRKRKVPSPDTGTPVMRGRGDSGQPASPGSPGPDNPLARRFQTDGEPATVDLSEPARFHPPSGAEEDPQTAPLGMDPKTLGRVISRDLATGKFYIHPGSEDCPVLLENQTVLAPTELRRGDTIRVGEAEFKLLSRE